MRGFFRHPFEGSLVELDRDEFLDRVAGQLLDGQYAPGPVSIADVPKGEGAVRPGAILSITDRLVYTACVGEILPEVDRAMQWGDEPVDFAYPIRRPYGDPAWIGWAFKAWDRFRERSLEFLNGDVTYACTTDITGFYENIDLATLNSDLLGTGASKDVVRLLMECLNKWAQVPGRGVPQGQTASDILAKLYLNSVDRNLSDLGVTHRRYVDDIRIFCVDRAEAKRAMVQLATLLRKRGLNLQSAKSRILRADQARDLFTGVTTVIQRVQEKYFADMAEFLDFNPYAAMQDVERALEDVTEEVPIAILRETYRAYFVDVGPYEFDRTLFHFLVKRLGAAKDRFALDHCKTLLERHPDETSYVLAYFSAVGAADDLQAYLATYVESKEAVYPYQDYLIIEWLGESVTKPDAAVMRAVRRRAFDGNLPSYLRCASRTFLARHGSPADLESIQHAYDSASPAEQPDIMCCLMRMETGRRNGFLHRAANDGYWHGRAARWVRANAPPPSQAAAKFDDLAADGGPELTDEEPF
jgi:hypothetical protein